MLKDRKDQIVYRWLFEQEETPVPGDAPPDKQVHIFDFDDTLGETDNPNGVMLYVDGKPAHKTAQEAEAWVKSKGIGSKDLLKGPNGQAFEKPAGKEGFASYLSSAGLAKLQTEYPRTQQKVTPNEPKEPGEMLFIDFTPSSYVNQNTTKPIDSTINKLKQANSQGSDTMVITARASDKQKPGVDFAGQPHVPSNAEDMQAFLAKQGAPPSQGVLGVQGQNKGNEIIKKFFAGKPEEQQPEEVHFYDDLSKNTKEVEAALADKVPAETFIYGPGEFAHGGADPNKPNIAKPSPKKKKETEPAQQELPLKESRSYGDRLTFDVSRWQRMAGIKH
jgi:hypothetical protein